MTLWVVSFSDRMLPILWWKAEAGGMSHLYDERGGGILLSVASPPKSAVLDRKATVVASIGRQKESDLILNGPTYSLSL